MVGAPGQNKTIVIVASCPELGSLNPGTGPYDQEVMTKCAELREAGTIMIVFDRAGTSNASKEDTATFESASILQKAGGDPAVWKGLIKGTKWFQTYKGGVKKGLMAIAQERPGVNLEIVCIDVCRKVPTSLLS